jgi:hypothetical protein
MVRLFFSSHAAFALPSFLTTVSMICLPLLSLQSLPFSDLKTSDSSVKGSRSNVSSKSNFGMDTSPSGTVGALSWPPVCGSVTGSYLAVRALHLAVARKPASSSTLSSPSQKCLDSLGLLYYLEVFWLYQ